MKTRTSSHPACGFRPLFNLALAVALGFTLFAASGGARPVLADVAPPEKPRGGSIVPGGEITKVQMVSEDVLIEVIPLNFQGEARDPEELVTGRVTASFTLRNTGTKPETMQVRFPLVNPLFWYGPNHYKPIESIQVKVGGKAVDTTPLATTNPHGSDMPKVPWAGFDCAFPPGKDVSIEVQYMLKPEGYLPVAGFQYVLNTGAGWKGAIGAAHFTLRLPYAASTYNIYENLPHQVEKYEMKGNELIWTYVKDLEPTQEDDILVEVLVPQVWQAVLKNRQEVQASPQDAAAWEALGRAYLRAATGRKGYYVREDDGGCNLFTLAVMAYDQALALKPGDVGLLLGRAELLMNTLPRYIEDPGDLMLGRVLEDLVAVTTQEPGNPRALENLKQLQSLMAENVPLPTPPVHPAAVKPESSTAAQTPVPTPVKPETAAATQTSIPPAAPALQMVAPPEPVKQASRCALPFAGAAGLVLAGFSRRRGRK